jgi:hypothetical protein
MRRQIGPLFVAALVVTGGLPPCANAQIPTNAPFIMGAGPVPAWPGDQLMVCVADLEPVSFDISFDVVEISGGAPVSLLTSGPTTYPPLDSALHPPNPCVEVEIPASPTAPTAADPTPVIIIGRIEVNPQPLPPGAKATPVCPSPFTITPMQRPRATLAVTDATATRIELQSFDHAEPVSGSGASP